ncbi:MAG: TetR family transcriptional regulator [Mycobacteriales bacterium]
MLSEGNAGVDGRRLRWAEHRVARRTELIEAVITTVRARGPVIDLDDVSAVSGIGKAVLYRYFDDKADLFLAVGREVAERISSAVVAAVDGQREPRAMLAAGIAAFLRCVDEDPDLYRFVVHRPLTDQAVRDHSAVVGEHMSRLIGDLLRAAGLDSGVAEPWAFAMVGAVRAAAERWLDQRTLTRPALAAHLTDLLWSGAGAASPQKPARRRSARGRPSGS